MRPEYQELSCFEENAMHTANEFGWNNFFQQHLNTLQPSQELISKVIGTWKDLYLIHQEDGTELLAQVNGKIRHQALSSADFPAVGDWVMASPGEGSERAVISHIFPRQTKLSRQVEVAGRSRNHISKEQILAANVDIVFIVSSLNHDLNMRRLERYLIMVAESGARPVILLTKSDLCQTVEEKIDDVRLVAFSTPVHAVSAYEDSGIDALREYLQEGTSAVFVGSSGTGKSTLINRLLGEQIIKTREIREKDDKGKHTTTHRALYRIPNGGIIIDIPGIRGLGLEESGKGGVQQTFEDITELEKQCRFSNCQHGNEPGCAIQAAIEEGTLEEKRFENYIKLSKEIAYVQSFDDQNERRRYKEEREKRMKSISRFAKQLKKSNFY